MSEAKIPLIQQTIIMLTEKVEKIEKRQEEEAQKAQSHREESLKFHADLLEKLETRFAGKWTEKVLVFVGGAIGMVLIGAVMALIITKG